MTFAILAVLTIVLALGLFLAPPFFIRALARRDKYWIFTPANTFALIVTNEDETGDGMSGGGDVRDVLHGVPGHRLDKSAANPMDWRFVPGADPNHDSVLFQKLGVQSMGNIFWKPRVNIDRRLRFSTEEDSGKKSNTDPKEKKSPADSQAEELRTVTKTKKTKNVFFTGELTVKIDQSDTSDKLGLNFEIDFAFAREFPVRSVLKLADSAAFLTSLVANIVNNETSAHPAAWFYGGEDTDEHREALAEMIANNPTFADNIEREIGLDITQVSIRDIDMTPEHKRLMEAQVEAEKESRAQMIRVRNEAAQVLVMARARNKEQILVNDADADRVVRVIRPIAESELMVRVREADAYEKNETVTTYAPGAKPMISVGK
jgi:regulator of protease activity HflC (stomatin/prohibitin superfamily)